MFRQKPEKWRPPLKVLPWVLLHQGKDNFQGDTNQTLWSRIWSLKSLFFTMEGIVSSKTPQLNSFEKPYLFNWGSFVQKTKNRRAQSILGWNLLPQRMLQHCFEKTKTKHFYTSTAVEIISCRDHSFFSWNIDTLKLGAWLFDHFNRASNQEGRLKSSCLLRQGCKDYMYAKRKDIS